ncbi:MAG: hypothetical protein JNJ88_00300 [Planctomycetes bacterium]|nr:hypothetical protein [Planctomycetota bacterium]
MLTSPAPAPSATLRVIKREHARLSATPPNMTAAELEPCLPPVVKVLRADERVQVIRIECSCGRSAEIECLLAQSTPPAPAAKP